MIRNPAFLSVRLPVEEKAYALSKGGSTFMRSMLQLAMQTEKDVATARTQAGHTRRNKRAKRSRHRSKKRATA